MDLSTQLRIILLLVGAAVWLAIYWLGKRKSQERRDEIVMQGHASTGLEPTAMFRPVDELDEDELDTPAYMRRPGAREVQDYEPRIANADDYVSREEVRDTRPRFVDVEPRHSPSDPNRELADDQSFSVSAAAPITHEPIYSEPVYAASRYREPDVEFSEMAGARHEPIITDAAEVSDEVITAALGDVAATTALNVDGSTSDGAEVISESEAPTVPNIPVMVQPVLSPQLFSHAVREPGHPVAAPTLSQAVESSSAAVIGSSIRPPNNQTNSRSTNQAINQPARVQVAPATDNKPNAARRKIIALRLPMPERVPGSQLLPLLQQEQLQHGKFNIFHRMHGSGTVFSVASMVEPGSFDLQHMTEQQFPGVTLFMLLPGPLDGLIAYDQMLSCAQRLAHATGSVLHDERGSKLTAHSMERLREEVLDFQHLIGNPTASH
jgi:FtsZ-interacting cell division protein ZipA